MGVDVRGSGTPGSPAGRVVKDPFLAPDGVGALALGSGFGGWKSKRVQSHSKKKKRALRLHEHTHTHTSSSSSSENNTGQANLYSYRVVVRRNTAISQRA